MFYIINSNRCVGCGACANVCPRGAISIQNDVAVINQALCRQCGNCAATCPADAIYEIAPIYAQSGKGGDIMRGRGGFGSWHRARGRVNPYPFCRFYPLPRRWWAYGLGPYPMGSHPVYGYYPQMTPAYYPTCGPHR